MILAVLGILVLTVLCVLFVRTVAHEAPIRWPRRLRRRPRELRGDWWSRFEREFRAYERRQALEARRRRHPHDWPPPPR